MKSKLFLLALAITTSAGSAIAADFDWSSCSKEIGLWCAGANDDEAKYKCLHGDHDSELSKACDDKGVTPFEDKTGKPRG